MGLLMDPRLTGGALPPSLSPHPGVYQARCCRLAVLARFVLVAKFPL